MQWSDLVWAGLILGAAGFETWAAVKKPEATLSALLRRVFHIPSTAGRVAFWAVLGTTAAWLAWHIAG